MTVFGDILQNAVASQNVEISWLLGGTSYLRSSGAWAQDTDRYGFRMVAELCYRAAGAQILSMEFVATQAAPAAGVPVAALAAAAILAYESDRAHS